MIRGWHDKQVHHVAGTVLHGQQADGVLCCPGCDPASAAGGPEGGQAHWTAGQAG